MNEIEKSENQITLIYLSNTPRGKKTVALCASTGIPTREIDVTKTNLTGTQIVEIAKALGLKISELVNQEHPSYQTKHKDLELNDDDWIKLIRNDYELLKQPIAMRGEECILIDTPTDILKFAGISHNPPA